MPVQALPGVSQNANWIANMNAEGAISDAFDAQLLAKLEVQVERATA